MNGALVVPEYVRQRGAESAQRWLHSGCEWIEKMARYDAQGGKAKEMAHFRIRIIANDTGCLDWDDNVARAWAEAAAHRLNVKL